MQDNKLIAEFMGWDIESPTTLPSNLHLSNLELDNNEVLEYKFHTSWDWLMPVVEKIFALAVADENIELFYDVQTHIPDKTATYNAVVEFIKEYNDGSTRTS